MPFKAGTHSSWCAYDHWLVKPLQHQKSQRAEGRHGDDERQEALVALPAIALDEKEASRFLKALEHPDGRTVAKLADLRRRA
jgi:hypothetical protein